MVMLKTLKPYHIKADKNVVRIILAYQYFSVEIRKQVFQFIPIEANEIQVSMKTGKIENIEAIFAFQNGKEIINLSMAKLIALPDFLQQIDDISRQYYEAKSSEVIKLNESALNDFISELEKQNILRLIDQALDMRDEEGFLELTDLL